MPSTVGLHRALLLRMARHRAVAHWELVARLVSFLPAAHARGLQARQTLRFLEDHAGEVAVQRGCQPGLGRRSVSGNCCREGLGLQLQAPACRKWTWRGMARR